jgi:hypothetical protein
MLSPGAAAGRERPIYRGVARLTLLNRGLGVLK